MTLRRYAIVAILAVCLGGPIVEMFDHWDHTIEDGNDTEANVIVIALCVGVALSVAGVVVARLRAIAGQCRTFVLDLVLVREAPLASAISLPVPTSSPPPLPLRI